MNDARTAGGSDLLEVDIRSKIYSGVASPLEAVRGLAFHLRAGEVGALIGESGCGKSTILRIVAGLDQAFEGHVVRPGAGRLGIVFQEPRLLPWRTVEENVRLALGGAPAELDGLFGTLGLLDHRHRYPGELSLGLARRAAVARAFAVDPDLLLLDEPFVSLDPATAGRLRAALVAMLARKRVTTLMVTHDLEEALALADRLFFLSARPARVVAQRRLETPREHRDPAWIADRRRDIASGGGG